MNWWPFCIQIFLKLSVSAVILPVRPALHPTKNISKTIATILLEFDFIHIAIHNHFIAQFRTFFSIHQQVYCSCISIRMLPMNGWPYTSLMLAWNQNHEYTVHNDAFPL